MTWVRSLTGGLWGPSRQVQLWRVAAPCDDDWLLHHIDAVTLHEVLQQVEDVLCPRALECKDAWGRWGSSEAPKTQYLCFPKDRCPIFLYPSLPASQLPPQPFIQGVANSTLSLLSLKTDGSDLLPDHSQTIQTRGLPESKGPLFPHRFLSELGRGRARQPSAPSMQQVSKHFQVQSVCKVAGLN